MSALEARLEALGRAAALADGRLDAEDVAAARAVVRRAGDRLGLGLEATVVALAGPTGAGKSTLFNALAGADLVPTSVRRPTTSTATAAVWGDGAGALLDWLAVPRRHRRDGGRPAGLVLLDLPDFDSVEASHRREADRVVALADLLVWVVDPQKYADAALHERELGPLAGHAAAMVVVLNQADTLTTADADACRADLSRLLRQDGLDGVPVLLASARTGLGLDALGHELADRVARREAALDRLAADVVAAAEPLADACGEGRGRAGRVAREDRARLLAALGESAGVPAVVAAVDRAHRRRGALATGWPPTRWVRRLRPDPLRRLGLGDREGAEQRALGGDRAGRDRPGRSTGAPGAEEVPRRTSLPPATPVQRGQLDSAVRHVALAAAGDLPDPWPRLLRAAAAAHEEELADRLDRAVAGARVGAGRRPRWWGVAGALQRALVLVALAGALWLAGLAALGWLQLGDALPTPDVRGVPVPTALLAGGALAGLLLALLARLATGAGARRRAARAQRTLRERIDGVADELVLEPVQAELAIRDELCAAVATAAGARAARRPALGARR